MTTAKTPGRGWAYLGLLLGLAGSVAGNVANTILTDTRVTEWLRVPFAVAWPVWTWVGIEVLTRIEWRRHWSHWIARLILMGPTTLVAAFVSYLHLHHLMVLSGEPGLAQAVGPLAIDGTLFGCTVALLVTRAQERTAGQERTRRTLAQRVAEIKAGADAVVAAVKMPVRPVEDPDPDLELAPRISPVELGPERPALLPLDQGLLDLQAKADQERQKVPAQRPRTSTLRGTWDVAKAVQLILDGEKDADVAATVGVGPKQIQRTRRAVQAFKVQGPHAHIPVDWKVPDAVVQVIREEARRWS